MKNFFVLLTRFCNSKKITLQIYLCMIIGLSLAFFQNTITEQQQYLSDREVEILSTVTNQLTTIEKASFVTITLAELLTGSNRNDEKLITMQMPSYKRSISNAIKRADDEFLTAGKLSSFKMPLALQSEEEQFQKLIKNGFSYVKDRWQKFKYRSKYLQNRDNLRDLNKYEEALLHLKREKILITDALKSMIRSYGELAKAQKDFLNLLRYLNGFLTSILIVFGVYLTTVFLRAFANIKEILAKMSSGKLDNVIQRSNKDEFRDLYDHLKQFQDNMQTLLEISSKIITTNKTEEVLLYIDDQFKKFVPFYSLDMIHNDSRNNILKKHIENSKIRHERPQIKEIEVFSKTVKKNQNIMIPININNAYLGYVQFNFKNNQEIKEEYLDLLKLTQHNISIAFHKGLLSKDLIKIVITSLANISESKDPETGRHVIRMSQYAYTIAKRLYQKKVFKGNVNLDFVENILISSTTHDIGKITLPDAVLLKQGKLTDKEFKIMEKHTSEGARILQEIDNQFMRYNLNQFTMAVEISQSHHEKFDGSGYPKKLRGQSIPISARICALADVFDALTSKRAYKDAFSLDKAYEIIEESRGKHFDPQIVNAFFQSKAEIVKIYNRFKEV